jgi:hypothetical protein
MIIVNSKEFRDHQKNEQVIVKRKNQSYKLVPISEDDLLVGIPKEYRCDPYEISPSGDMFWADKRNVEKVKKAVEDSKNGNDKGKIIYSTEELKSYLKSL